MAGFGDLVDDMDAMLMSSLNDGTCDYQGPHGEPPVYDIDVMIDHNLQRAGPEGIFITAQVGITWRKAVLPSAGRGGIFTYDGKRYRLEDVIDDDGHMVTAACMELS